MEEIGTNAEEFEKRYEKKQAKRKEYLREKPYLCSVKKNNAMKPQTRFRLVLFCQRLVYVAFGVEFLLIVIYIITNLK